VHDFQAEPGGPLPDCVPDDLIARYGRDARKRVRHNLSRRRRLGRSMVRAARTSDSELWQTTAFVFFFGVIALCGLGGIAYAVYLWPRVGLSLLGTLIGLFVFSFYVARRISAKATGRQAASPY